MVPCIQNPKSSRRSGLRFRCGQVGSISQLDICRHVRMRYISLAMSGAVAGPIGSRALSVRYFRGTCSSRRPLRPLGAAGKILSAPGVIQIVGTREGPIPVARDQMRALQQVVATRLAVEPWTLLSAGHRVCVEAGPLRGLEGLVVTVKSRYRLVISIELLQRSVAVEIDSAWVSIPVGMLLNASTTSPAPEPFEQLAVRR